MVARLNLGYGAGAHRLDEFSDAICACLPIEDSTISFTVESVLTVPDAMSSP